MKIAYYLICTAFLSGCVSSQNNCPVEGNGKTLHN